MKLTVSIGTALILASLTAACSPAAQEPAGDAAKPALNMTGLSQTSPNLSADELGRIAKDSMSDQSSEDVILAHADREMKRRGLESPVPLTDEERHEANLALREKRAERDATEAANKLSDDWGE